MPRVTFLGGPEGPVVADAEPGETLLEVAERTGAMMGSACGGVCACSSCHAWVLEGLGRLPPASDAEEDRLDMAFDVRPNSRLGCQVRVGNEPIVVQLTRESIQTWYDEHPDRRPAR
jgi:2Fe-2S ferredoxin